MRHGLYQAVKWFMNDCAVGTVLIVLGVLIGWITAPAIYWLWKTLHGILWDFAKKIWHAPSRNQNWVVHMTEFACLGSLLLPVSSVHWHHSQTHAMECWQGTCSDNQLWCWQTNDHLMPMHVPLCVSSPCTLLQIVSCNHWPWAGLDLNQYSFDYESSASPLSYLPHAMTSLVCQSSWQSNPTMLASCPSSMLCSMWQNMSTNPATSSSLAP